MRAVFSIAAISAVLLAAAPAHADEAAVKALLAKKAAIIQLMHKKARKALVTAAQDVNFGRYFAPADGEEKARIKNRIDHISLNVQSKFHVEEMCLIGADGAEQARIVRNEIADDLSPDETGAIFFAPGFAQRPRKVHVSPIYMSVDVDKWVVAYVTPVVADGEKKAILHYEHGLHVFQAALNKRMDGDRVFIAAVNRDGWVVSDSRREIGIDRRDGSDSPGHYFDRKIVGGMTAAQIRQAVGGGEEGFGAIEAGGDSYTVAFRTMERWTLFVFERR